MAPRTRVHDWSAITLNDSESFSAALELMNRGGYQLSLVLRGDGRLAGMVTDSDVRKALLRGIGLEEPIAKVMNDSPLVVSVELGEAEAHQLMVLNHFFHLPIVDIEGKLVGLHVAEQLRSPEPRNEPLVIMAGGRGKRLMPLTASTPKPMLPLNGRPILEHIIHRAKGEGFNRIFISVNYLASAIIGFFGDGENHGVNISYLNEDQPLGTAGALSNLPKAVRDEPFVVTNGDVITDVSYVDMLNQVHSQSVDGLMAIRLQDWQSPFGVVTSKGNQLIGLEEKPKHTQQVNAGIYVVSPNLTSLLDKGCYCDMTDLFTNGLKKGLNLQVFPLHEQWIDIGRLKDYESISQKT